MSISLSVNIPIWFNTLKAQNGTIYPDAKKDKSVHINFGYDYKSIRLYRDFLTNIFNVAKGGSVQQTLTPKNSLLFTTGRKMLRNNTLDFIQVNQDNVEKEDIRNRYSLEFNVNTTQYNAGWITTNKLSNKWVSQNTLNYDFKLDSILHGDMKDYAEYKYDFIRESPYNDVIKTLRVSNSKIRLTPVKDIMSRRLSTTDSRFKSSPFFVHRGHRDAMFHIAGDNNIIVIDHNVRCDPILFNSTDGNGSEWQSAFFIEGKNNIIIFNVREDFVLYNMGSNGDLGGTNWASSDGWNSLCTNRNDAQQTNTMIINVWEGKKFRVGHSAVDYGHGATHMKLFEESWMRTIINNFGAEYIKIDGDGHRKDMVSM